MKKKFYMFYNIDRAKLKKMLRISHKLDPIYNKKGEVKKLGHYLIPTAFDIETSKDDETCAAYMYIWQFGIYDNVIFGRTWKELIDLLKMIMEVLQLASVPYKLTVLIHNTSYEWQFMRKYLIKEFRLTGFFLDTREPVTFGISANRNSDKVCIEFQDSMKLSQCGLRATAKTYCKTQKLPDFDYDIPRNHLTKLNDRELEYCANDVLILTEYYEYLIEHIVKPQGYLPITQTQIPRKIVKSRWAQWRGKKGNPNYFFVADCCPNSYKVYKSDMEYLFRGGYTHANAENADIEINEPILHIDFTSSYPSVLLHDYYPVSAFRRVTFDEKYLDTKCCKLVCEFTNLRAKSPITYDSFSKCINKKEIEKLPTTVVDNGRIFKAEKYLVKLTELDLKIYDMVYEWDSCEVKVCQIAERGELPTYLTDTVIEFYKMKADIKQNGDPKGKDKLIYEYYKRNVNALYGMMCTKENIKEILLEEADMIPRDLVEELTNNWKKYMAQRFLSPYWGIWCTSHARYRLFNLIGKLIEMGKTEWYYYSDTDSHFTADVPYIRDFITDYNKEIARLNLKYDPLLSDLGEFDLEHSPEKNPIHKFKTLGAKRYLLLTDKGYECTVAGLPKNFVDDKGNSINVFEYKTKDMPNPFDFFTDDMCFDLIDAHKNAHYYNDAKQVAYINGVKEESEASVYIFPVSFTMKISKAYKMQIESIKEKRNHG